MTTLAHIIKMETSLIKIIFGRNIFICQPIFEIFVVLIKTFRMQKDVNITICYRCFQSKVKESDEKRVTTMFLCRTPTALYHYVNVSVLIKFSQKTTGFTFIIRSSP